MQSKDESGLLGFKYWPFDIVPRQGQELVWADRAALRKQVDQLGRRLGKHSSVSLHLLWADFGAGKTHTMLYLKQEAERGRYGSVLPFYAALPKGCRTFLDIYRALVRAIPMDGIAKAYRSAEKRLGRPEVEQTIGEVWASLGKCFHAIAIGNDSQQQSAWGWLNAESGIPTRDLQALSIYGRVRLPDDAERALIGIVKLFNLAGHGKVLLMVDEFQRVEVLRKQQQDDINAGLHGFFNACSQGMSLLLAFSFGVEENIKHFLNAELLSRADPLRISIPSLTREEGLTFLSDLTNLARDPKTAWPVSDDVLPAVISAIPEKLPLTPRRVIKAANLAFELAEIDLEDKVITKITGAYVNKLAERGDFLRLDEEEGEG